MGDAADGWSASMRVTRCSNCERLASAAFNGVTLNPVKTQMTERRRHNLAEWCGKFMVIEGRLSLPAQGNQA
jgi:hypothetical protein